MIMVLGVVQDHNDFLSAKQNSELIYPNSKSLITESYIHISQGRNRI